MEIQWHFTNNQFETATRGSFKRANILNNDHMSRLTAQNADPEIAALVARTITVSQQYSQRYSGWISASGTYKGHTNLVDGMLLYLSNTKIKEWDIQIQAVHLEGTPQYMMILPNRRGPFQEGTKDDRLSAVEALAITLQDYPTLPATQADVVAFGNALRTARDNQQQKEQAVINASSLLEKARHELCTMMYGNLGVLMDKYRDTPSMIENFWQLDLIRRTGQGNDDDLPATAVVIRGKVADTVTGLPLAGVRVRVYEQGADPAGQSIEVFTDAQGDYVAEIPDLPYAVLATIEVMLTGYGMMTRSLSLSPGGDYPDQDFFLTPTP